jgi:hypothetical protein
MESMLDRQKKIVKAPGQHLCIPGVQCPTLHSFIVNDLTIFISSIELWDLAYTLPNKT